MTELIVALDVDTLREAGELVGRLHGTVSHFKIGMRLFTAHGKRAVDLVRRSGGKVFLDLKLFDIPETVAQTVRQAQRLGAESLSLHLLGGSEMIKAAASVSPRPALWGVTVLTSLDSEDLGFIHPELAVGSLTARLARLAVARRLDGIICSAREVRALRRSLGPDVCFITPGIRPEGHGPDDQRRVMTPAEAAELGVRFVVVGRPVTRASDPLAAARDMIREMESRCRIE